MDYLAIDAGKEWSRPLRGSAKKISFVSFQIYPSQGTIVDIGGVRLGFTAGPIAGSVQMMYDESTGSVLKWQPLDTSFRLGQYGGKTLAAPSTFTVRLNPAGGFWDLYSAGRLVAADLPLIGEKKEDRRFVLRAGTDGAWLSGLVFADENPIYADENANGIDDKFEIQKLGSLLPPSAPSAAKKQLVDEWQKEQRTHHPAAFGAIRPQHDKD